MTKGLATVKKSRAVQSLLLPVLTIFAFASFRVSDGWQPVLAGDFPAWLSCRTLLSASLF